MTGQQGDALMAGSGRKGSDVLASLRGDLSALTPKGRPFVVSGAIPLFSEAAIAYDAGAFQLAALGCRAAVESACYLFLTRRWSRRSGGWRIEGPRLLDGKTRDVSFEELKNAAIGPKGIPEGLRTAVDQIQSDGNLTAHLA